MHDDQTPLSHSLPGLPGHVDGLNPADRHLALERRHHCAGQQRLNLSRKTFLQRGAVAGQLSETAFIKRFPKRVLQFVAQGYKTKMILRVVRTVSIFPLLIKCLEEEERDTFLVSPRTQSIIKSFLLVLVSRFGTFYAVGRSIDTCPTGLPYVDGFINAQLAHVIEY